MDFCYSLVIKIGFQNDGVDGFSFSAPSRKKCWLFGDRSEENRPQTDIQALWDLTLLLCGQPAPTDNVGKLSGPLENTNLISEVADCGRMCRR